MASSSSSDQKRQSDVWVLDTETKGTGANMVPLERTLRKGSDRVPGFTLPARRPQEAPVPQAPQPHRFQIVDVMTRQVLADDVALRAALETLAGVRSIVDVTIATWNPETGAWRRLTFGEAKALWALRDQLGHLGTSKSSI